MECKTVMRRSKGASRGKKNKAPVRIDLGKETERDWECAARFNKIVWSVWPKSNKTMFGLADWLRKKGYVVRWRMPMASDGMNTTKWLMDLMIGEKESIHDLFHHEKLPSNEKVKKQVIAELRLAQRSRLVCTSSINESNGESFLFALFREIGTMKCLVFFTYQ